MGEPIPMWYDSEDRDAGKDPDYFWVLTERGTWTLLDPEGDDE